LKSDFAVVEERDDESGNYARRKIEGALMGTTVNGKQTLAEVYKTDDGVVRREIKGIIRVINEKKNWYEEVVGAGGGVDKRPIRGIVRRLDESGSGKQVLCEEWIDLNRQKVQKIILGVLKEESGLEVLCAMLTWVDDGRKELLLECLRGGKPETIKIGKAGAVLDGGNKRLTEEYIDWEGRVRIRQIAGAVKLVGKTNTD
jgi:hypothetical protein